ncbi:molybdenum cofactor guanylyltransferase [Methanobrevibacter cuticularis]|uniref:Molybdenum cofactor guanylyltransferase n=1 Tax=Methanobrevibacter cuticularis TaxID=47311 RepID=A0A166FBV6_9EURY|nr:NTP transferase domain-containing protein [Methanobrevibacter cuticularis]KZX17513.1 molybdenum cofactor guanylyltransferase [Methanobrevibacter cuticularis]
MVSISAIITAAGKSSRMINDQKERNIPSLNKLILPIDSKGKTIIELTIENILNIEIDECIVVVSHDDCEITEALYNINDDRLKIVHNGAVTCELSESLYNGIKNSKSEFIFSIAGDQPTISAETYNNMVNKMLNSENPKKTISILRRNDIGLLKTAKGLGMPFIANREELLKYLKNQDDNLNPILRKMHRDGFTFYGIKEKDKFELLNINNHEDYQLFLEFINTKSAYF